MNHEIRAGGLRLLTVLTSTARRPPSQSLAQPINGADTAYVQNPAARIAEKALGPNPVANRTACTLATRMA
jgi:hypothetical protein